MLFFSVVFLVLEIHRGFLPPVHGEFLPPKTVQYVGCVDFSYFACDVLSWSDRCVLFHPECGLYPEDVH